jgi:hypothetical protein
MLEELDKHIQIILVLLQVVVEVLVVLEKLVE